MRNAPELAATLLSYTSPLALDETGSPVALPEGGAGWRIRRHTRGRPKLQLDGNRQPMQFPLSYSLNDAEDILAPGTYRLDLVDAKGAPLEFTTQIHVGGGLRNADVSESLDDADNENPAARLPSTASDVRLVLEANVRSTQLAFQHNERTLTASLRMADTLREGVQALAEAQADFLKSMSSARGFFRNAAPAPALPAPPAANDAGDDDDDDNDDESDEEIQPAAPTNYFDLLMPFSEAIAGKVADMVPGLFVAMPAKQAQPTDAAPSGATSESPDPDLASRSFEARELFDIGYAHRKGEAKRAATGRSAPAVPLQARIMKDPQLVRQIMAIKSALAPDEIETLLSAAAATWSDAEQAQFLATIKPLPADHAVVFCREVITTIRAQQAGFDGTGDDGPVSEREGR